MICYIGLANTDKKATVDKEDYPVLSRYKWSLDAKGYAKTQAFGTTVKMHRLILNPGKADQVDHINLDKLDNRKDNLRICTNALNQANVRKREYVNGKKTTSKFKGVHLKKSTGLWVSRLSSGNKRYSLGQYVSEVEAAVAYNIKAREVWGEFALLNEIENESSIVPNPVKRNKNNEVSL